MWEISELSSVTITGRKGFISKFSSKDKDKGYRSFSSRFQMKQGDLKKWNEHNSFHRCAFLAVPKQHPLIAFLFLHTDYISMHTS